MKIITEPYSRQDFDAVLALFYETVHQVNCADYSQAQLDAWAPKEADAGRHKGELTAFAVWDGGAYFDCLFVRPAYLRRGIATSLADLVEAAAKSKGEHILQAHVSLTAYPFFKQRGYVVTRRQRVCRALKMRGSPQASYAAAPYVLSASPYMAKRQLRL